MDKLTDIISKLNSVSEKEFESKILEIVDSKKNEVLDMNTSQLFSGRDSSDQNMTSYYSEGYAEMKNLMNPTPGLGNPDLKLTGDFYKGFFLKDDTFPISFSSTDNKTEMLTQKYGENIFGLDNDNLEKLRQDIKPEIQEYIGSVLRL